MYDPTTPPSELAAAIATAFTQKVTGSVGIQAAEEFERPHVPRRLPAVQLVLSQAAPSGEEGPLGYTEWTFLWRVDLYLQMKDYVVAQRQLLDLVPRILQLPIKERRLAAEGTGGPHEILNGTCDEWAVSDPGDDPDPREGDDLLSKNLVLRAVVTTIP
jgi:hypothetical protein